MTRSTTASRDGVPYLKSIFLPRNLEGMASSTGAIFCPAMSMPGSCDINLVFRLPKHSQKNYDGFVLMPFDHSQNSSTKVSRFWHCFGLRVSTARSSANAKMDSEYTFLRLNIYPHFFSWDLSLSIRMLIIMLKTTGERQQT